MALPTHPPAVLPISQATDDELIARWIEPDPHYPTADRARIADRAVSVTAVVLQLRLENGDVAAARRAYDLPPEALAAALAYYRRHQAVIDARITLDQAWFAAETTPVGSPDEDALIARWIEPDPHYPTADRARIADRAVSVTAVVLQLRLENGDVAAARRAYDLPPEALAAALAYYRRHQAVIDARITLDLTQWSE